MSIATRISSIEEHIRQSYQGLRNIGIDTTNINKNLENIPKLLDNYWEYLPKVTGNGTNITLNDTKEAKMKLELLPDTQQETTTGKNLFNGLTGRTEKTPSGGLNGVRDFTGNGIYKGFTRNNYYISNNVSSYSIIDNNNIALSVETGYYGLGFDFIVEPNTNYIVNFTSLNEGVFAGAGFFDEDGNYIDNVSNAKNGFTTPSTCKYVLLCFTKNSSGNISFLDVQLEKGSSSTPFEKYTGGIPAPNPDYPQEIKVVTGNQNIKIENKNLLNNTTFVKGRVDNGVIGYADGTNSITPTATGLTVVTNTQLRGAVSELIKITPNLKYTLNFEETLQSYWYADFYDENEDYVSRKGISVNRTFTTPSEGQYVRISMQLTQVGTNTITNLQLEQSETASTFIAHQEQNYPLTLGNVEYCKIGDYSDRIFKNVVGDVDYDSSRELGKWYIKKNIGKTINVENLFRDFGTGGDNKKYVLVLKTALNMPTGSQYTNKMLCNKFNEQTVSANRQPGQFLTNSNNASVQFIVDSTYTSLAEVKAGITNVTVYGVLETPTYELLSNTLQDQLNALEDAISYDNQTNVNSSGDLASILNANALEDLSEL
jgi:hypothetical protein